MNGEGAMTAEQEARDMLDRMGVEDAQAFTAGDLVELANLITEVGKLCAAVAADRGLQQQQVHRVGSAV